MGKDERTGIGLALALTALVLLGIAYVQPLWSFEHSTGRQVAPEGPDDGTGVERHDIHFYPAGWQGDMAPSDPDAAEGTLASVRNAVYVAAGAMALYVLGQVPGISRIITRPWCMLLSGVATTALVLAAAWVWIRLPQSMAAMGVEGPFTARLLEEGYIRSHLSLGWVAVVLASVAAVSTVLAAYSAGNADPRAIEEYGVSS